MTTDEKVEVITKWNGFTPVRISDSCWREIGFLWPVAKKVVEKCTKLQHEWLLDNSTTTPIPPTTVNIGIALAELSEEKLLDALYEAVVKLNEYQKQ